MKQLLFVLAVIFIGVPIAFWLVKTVLGISFGLLGFVLSHFWPLLILGGIAYAIYRCWGKSTQ